MKRYTLIKGALEGLEFSQMIFRTTRRIDSELAMEWLYRSSTRETLRYIRIMQVDKKKRTIYRIIIL